MTGNNASQISYQSWAHSLRQYPSKHMFIDYTALVGPAQKSTKQHWKQPLIYFDSSGSFFKGSTIFLMSSCLKMLGCVFVATELYMSKFSCIANEASVSLWMFVMNSSRVVSGLPIPA